MTTSGHPDEGKDIGAYARVHFRSFKVTVHIISIEKSYAGVRGSLKGTTQTGLKYFLDNFITFLLPRIALVCALRPLNQYRDNEFFHPQGLSNGSDPPKPPVGFVAAGVAADVHPPKSSSAATVGCAVGLLAPEIGAPHPPEISLGVMRDGTLPSSTLGAAGFAGSGAPQAFESAPPHGSNILALDCEVMAGRVGWGTGAGLGAVVVGEDKLNAELKAGGLCIGGDGIFATGAGGGLDGADAKSLKPSSANRSAGMDVA